MGQHLTNIGEEWYTENNLSGVTVTVGLYNDATDTIVDSDTLASITTEPTNTNYARASDTISTYQDANSDFGFQNDTQLTFDFSDQTTSETVDSYFVVVNFIADTTAGQGTATDNLVATGLLDQARDIGSIDTLNLAAGGVSVTLD